jgi:26S proteasome regulatory subunit N1
MAHGSETPKPLDKGKGKAIDGETGKGKEIKKDKDGKPLVNGKEEEPVFGGMFKTDAGVEWFN